MLCAGSLRFPSDASRSASSLQVDIVASRRDPKMNETRLFAWVSHRVRVRILLYSALIFE